MKLREALQELLAARNDHKALSNLTGPDWDAACEKWMARDAAAARAARAALAEPVADEPAFWRYRWIHNSENRADVVTPNDGTTPPNRLGYTYPPEPLYTSPAAQEPVADDPVGDEQIKRMYVEFHGTEEGWLGVEGSYFTSGVSAARKLTCPAATPAERGEYPPLPVDDLATPSGGREAGPEEERIEASYWRFDARHKGHGQWKQAPMSERDAFKAEMRNALEAEKVRAEMRLVGRGWRPLSDADRAQRVPLTEAEIMELTRDEFASPRWPSSAIEVARAIERAHGIGAKP